MGIISACNYSRMGIHSIPMSTISDSLIDRLLQRLASGTIKRTDLVTRVRVSQSTFNRWKLRQAKPTGMQRASLERVLDALDKREPIPTPDRTEEPASEPVRSDPDAPTVTPVDLIADW